jgi:hypothetical protein
MRACGHRRYSALVYRFGDVYDETWICYRGASFCLFHARRPCRTSLRRMRCRFVSRRPRSMSFLSKRGPRDPDLRGRLHLAQRPMSPECRKRSICLDVAQRSALTARARGGILAKQIASEALQQGPSEFRRRRECRVPIAPAASRANEKRHNELVNHGHTGLTRHSPRDGFNWFPRTLPGDRAFLSPSQASMRCIATCLASASRRQDHTN